MIPGHSPVFHWVVFSGHVYFLFKAVFTYYLKMSPLEPASSDKKIFLFSGHFIKLKSEMGKECKKWHQGEIKLKQLIKSVRLFLFCFFKFWNKKMKTDKSEQEQL